MWTRKEEGDERVEPSEERDDLGFRDTPRAEPLLGPLLKNIPLA